MARWTPICFVILGLVLSSGCRMCAHPYDYCGPTFTGACGDGGCGSCGSCGGGGDARCDPLYRAASVLGHGMQPVPDGQIIEGEFIEEQATEEVILDDQQAAAMQPQPLTTTAQPMATAQRRTCPHGRCAVRSTGYQQVRQVGQTYYR